MLCLGNNLFPDSSPRGSFLSLLNFDFHSLKALKLAQVRILCRIRFYNIPKP